MAASRHGAGRKPGSARGGARGRLLFDVLEARLLFSAVPSVVGRYIYYGGTPRWGDVAASDKSVLLAGQTASFANITTYSGGINEIVLDVANGASYGPGDFTARVGQTGNPDGWPYAAQPTSVTNVAGAGINGSTRVYVRWADGTLCNTWVQVTFTPASETFYVGNLAGETGDWAVTAADEAAVRNNFSSFLTPIEATNAYDFNRDGKVDPIDELISRAAQGNTLALLTAPDDSSSNPAAAVTGSISVVGRYVYYGQTPYYGDVWASDKSVLLPAQTATYANVTNYVEGINEIVLDVTDGTGSFSASDFVFRSGFLPSTSFWELAPAPTSVTTAIGGGVAGSNRVTVRWAAGSMVDTWLQVTFTPARDTFYVGNLVGATSALQVTSEDETAVRAHFSPPSSPEPVTSPYDFNRDGTVDETDAQIAGEHSGYMLWEITAPGTVLGRYIYYGNTPYYGDIWARDKTAILNTETAITPPGLNNLSSHPDGITELVLDVANGNGIYSANDFTFRMGQGGNPANWYPAPAPISVSTAPGLGVNGSTRIFIRWEAGAIRNSWLQVTFWPVWDVFYVGSLVGATNGLIVTGEDQENVRANYSSLLTPQPVTSYFDFNRDGKVDAIDELITRNSSGNQLTGLTPDLWIDGAMPAAPNNLQAVVQEMSEVALSWTDDDPNAMGYRIERQVAGSGIWTQIGVVGQDIKDFIDSSVQPNMTYFYLVSAINEKWSSGRSNVAMATLSDGITHDADGWTLVTPAADTQIVYVSSSTGNDSNPGTQAAPVRTIAKAKSMFTSGHPVWLLLKCGDTFNESMGGWNWPGTDANAPSVIGSYGSGARPIVATGSSTAINFVGSAGPAASHIFIMGLDFYANYRDPNSPDFSDPASTPDGIMMLRGGTNFLIENCRFRYYATNLVIQGYDAPLWNFTLRRSVITDAYSAVSNVRSQGIYMWNVNGWLIEDNVFDHNGWNTQVAGAEPTIYNHNLYLDSVNPGGTVRNNIVANGAASGIMNRAGGIVTGNLVVNNPVSIIVGNGYGIATDPTQVLDNVILAGSDILANPILVRGYGIDVNPTNPSTLVQGNVIANAISNGPAFAICFAPGGVNYTATGNVIYNWGSYGIKDNSGMAFISPGQVNPAGLVDPSRGIQAYMASLGQAPQLAVFLAGARNQSKDSWNAAYTAQAANAFIRQGFVTVAPTDMPATAADSTTVNIVWNAVASTASYMVERSMDDGITWVQVAVPTAATTLFQDTLLISGTRYYYRIAAVDGIEPSAVSLMVNVLLPL